MAVALWDEDRNVCSITTTQIIPFGYGFNTPNKIVRLIEIIDKIS